MLAKNFEGRAPAGASVELAPDAQAAAPAPAAQATQVAASDAPAAPAAQAAASATPAAQAAAPAAAQVARAAEPAGPATPAEPAGPATPAEPATPAAVKAPIRDEIVIEARGLELKSPLGCPYSGVTLDVKRGEVFAVCGRNGSGKTSLLLTLGGRMLFTKGSLNVLGYKLPRERGKLQKRVGLGLIKGQNDLPETQPVHLAVAAEFDLYKRKPTKEAVEAYLEQWELQDYANLRIRELTERKLVQLGIALAWVGHPDIIVVDDIESQLVKAQSVEMMKRLLALAHERNVTVLVAVLERDLAAMADQAYYLEAR